jgi:hypothetical protein
MTCEERSVRRTNSLQAGRWIEAAGTGQTV